MSLKSCSISHLTEMPENTEKLEIVQLTDMHGALGLQFAV